MRLLVTDPGLQALRQATAWLIMTFGRKIMKTLLRYIILLTLCISASAASLLDKHEAFILELNFALESKNSEKLYAMSSREFREFVRFEQFKAVVTSSDVDGLAILSCQYGKRSAFGAISIRHGITSPEKPLTYWTMIFTLQDGYWRYHNIPFLLSGPAGISDRIQSGIEGKEPNQ